MKTDEREFLKGVAIGAIIITIVAVKMATEYIEIEQKNNG